MATTTNYGWTTPNDTDLVKDGAAAIRTLGSSVDTTTKNLNPETTLGDIAYRSSSANVKTRLGIGTVGQVLTVASGVPSWATPAGGGGMTLLSTTTLAGASTTISSISQDYVNLLILVNSVDCTNASGIQVTFNATNQQLGYAGAATVSPSGAIENAGSNNFIELRGSQHNITASDTNNVFSVTINNYASSTYRKTFSGNSYFFGSSAYQAVVYGGGTTMTTAISSLKFATTAGTFNAGTVLLYGVK
jgi:hypothetical protein